MNGVGLIGAGERSVNYNPPGRSAEWEWPVSFGVEASAPEASQPESHVSKEVPSSKGLKVQFSTSDGCRGELYWGEDILASVGGAGGTVNVKYHDDSTKEDPVVIAWGVDSGGKEYERIIHLNEVNPGCASPAEMIALNAHLYKSGNMDAAENGPGALWTAVGEGYDANAKMDFEQYFNNFIAMQQLSNNSKSVLYQLELERYRFFHQQNEKFNFK